MYSRGHKDVGIIKLQEALNSLGYDLAVDGAFGKNTEYAVIDFQKKHSLIVDGVVGGNTSAKIIEAIISLQNNNVGLAGANQEWMEHAYGQINVHEVQHASTVQQYWRDARLSGLASHSPSKIPWCSGFVCAMMERAGIRSARTDGAKNWLNWGQELTQPLDGCIVVFTRKGGGHVGFVVGEDDNGNLLVLGGNQGDAVNIKSFDRRRVTGYRYPEGVPLPPKLSKGVSTKLSNNES